MIVLAYVPNYLPGYCSGDTTHLHTILSHLQTRWHEITVMLPKALESYEYEGIEVIGRRSSAFREADLVICQLDTTVETLKLAQNKPILWIMHNSFPYPSVTENKAVGVVYNAEWAIEATDYKENHSFVLPPAVDREFYDIFKGVVLPISDPMVILPFIREKCGAITLINCNENKGGKIFHELAKRMPEHNFLEVIGAYGEQYVGVEPGEKPWLNWENAPIINGLGVLPNLKVIEHQPDLRSIYAQTRILLMPSIYESWGRVATEAMCSGIPVICTNTPGLWENVGKDNGIFIEDRNDLNSWVMAIKKLDGKKEYDEASAHSKKRSYEHDGKEKLEKFGQFAEKFVATHKKKAEHGTSDRR